MKKEERNATKIIKKFSEDLPRFPDGRINYSNSEEAAVLICFVTHKNEILILKRSDEVGFYGGKWNVISGYLDELKPVQKKALEEIQEELRIEKNEISSIKVGKPWRFEDPNLQKAWIVFPILAKLKRKPEINLNWENIDFKWIKTHELKKFDTVPHLNEDLIRTILKLKTE